MSKQLTDSQQRGLDFQRYVARYLEGHETPGSGSGRIKGDVRVGPYVLECKSCRRKNGTPYVRTEWLRQITFQSGHDLEPGVVVDLGAVPQDPDLVMVFCRSETTPCQFRDLDRTATFLPEFCCYRLTNRKTRSHEYWESVPLSDFKSRTSDSR